MRSYLEREDWGSNLGPVKSDPVLFFEKDCVAEHNDAEMGPAKSLHVSE